MKNRLTITECPVCGQELDEDTAIYISADGGVCGCENCVSTTYPCILEEDLRELEQDRIDSYLWRDAKDRRYGLNA